jgi:hypothetical protein
VSPSAQVPSSPPAAIAAAPAPASASPFSLPPAVERADILPPQLAPAPESIAPTIPALPVLAVPAVAELPPLSLPPAPQPAPVSAPALVEAAPALPPAPQTLPAPEDVPAQVSMRLVSVLRSVSHDSLGFDAARVPDTVMVDFPLSLIRPQLATGRVQVGLNDIISGVAEKFRPAFARAEPSLVASLPLSELFHALPSEAIPAAAPSPVAPPAAVFETPFSNRAVEDATRIPLPAPVVPPAPAPAALQMAPLELPPLLLPPSAPEPAGEIADAQLPSFITAHDDLGTPQPASTLSTPPPSHLALRGAVAAPAPDPSPLAIELPELTKPIGFLPPLPMPQTPPAPPAPVATAPAPAPSPFDRNPPPLGVVNPALSDSSFAEHPTYEPAVVLAPEPIAEISSPAVAPAPVPVSAPAPVSQDFQFGYREHPAHMSLRHWLQVSGEMSPAIALAHVARLAGVRAAVLMTGSGISAAGDATDAEAAFFDKAGLRYQSLKMMLENMGQPVQGSFTMRLDNVASTFFLEEKICLAVLQDEASLADEMRDKLTLVTRELASLSN